MLKISLTGPFSNIMITKQLVLFVIAAILVLSQSLGIIYTKQTKRLLHAKLQSLYAARDKLQVEWSQLLLEQGTWEADARVERVAREQLGMVVPNKINVIIS
mgnify:CR=1 FL=1